MTNIFEYLKIWIFSIQIFLQKVVHPLPSMIFYFATNCTIAFNGFLWLRTIGQTMSIPIPIPPAAAAHARHKNCHLAISWEPSMVS